MFQLNHDKTTLSHLLVQKDANISWYNNRTTWQRRLFMKKIYTEEQKIEILQRYWSGEPVERLSTDTGVAKSTIYRRNLITSVIWAVEKKTNRTVVVGFAGILQISHKFWSISEIAVRLQKIRNGVKSRFLYRFLKTNNTPIELLWFRFGVLFMLEAPPGIGPGNKGFADLCLTAWLWRLIKVCGHDASCPLWSGLRGSNPPPRPWQGRALPNELNPRMVPRVGIEPTTL